MTQPMKNVTQPTKNIPIISEECIENRTVRNFFFSPKKCHCCYGKYFTYKI